MRARDVEQQSRGIKWWYVCAIGPVLACLVVALVVSVRGANASPPSRPQVEIPPSSVAVPEAWDGLQIAQAAQSQQSLLPDFGNNTNPSGSGPAPSTASGKGQAGAGLPTLGGSSTGDGAAGPGVGEAPAVPACSPNWNVASTPNGVFHDTQLFGVTEIAPNDVWAGGYYANDATPSVELPLLEHWDGTSWSVTYTPLPAGGVSGIIHAISANTSGDVWAVGSYYNGTDNYVLIERWGGVQWNVIAGANPSPTDNELIGVAAVSTNNVWAAGLFVSAGLNRTLAEHWDGSTWTHIASPNHGTGANALRDISVVPGSSGMDIWAVGYFYPTSAGHSQTLTLHYNSSSWSYVSSANQGAGPNELSGVHAISANDVWATGDYAVGSTNRTLAEHWNGSSWSITPTVDPNPHQDYLFKVFATASNDVWAAGYSATGASLPTLLVEHWNGSAWAVSTNTPVGYASQSIGISGGSSSDVWAVGAYVTTSSAPAESLTMHYNGMGWTAVRSADGPSSENILNAVGADSVNDVWAVGIADATVGGTFKSHGLVEHWNGSSWDIVTNPHPGPNTDQLRGVDVISPSNVWAVGYYINSGGFSQTLIEHWDGTIWSVVSSPNPGGAAHENTLRGVAAASANDVWAVGDYGTGGIGRTLILHWSGGSWVQFSSPYPGANTNSLSSVAVVPGSGGNDVWAAGYYRNTPGGHDLTLFERWNGTTWSVVSSPNAGGVDNEITKVFALSASDAWAAGYTRSVALGQNLVLHWDGTSWTSSPILQDGPHTNELFSVTGTASNDVYVVGGYLNAGAQYQALVEHWNGTAWSIVQSVAAPGIQSALDDMVLVTPTNMWAVGFYIPVGFTAPQTLVEHYNPCPTSCTITFTDVPPGSTFYPYIHCLACFGIINGYPDGTFRPNANVTRGQLSKIVSNSAGFSDPQTTQLFEDVPLSSTFQVFIGRLASRGYISGYPCGGTGEPCGPGHLPYFRPNANATRGQISKIDSNAAGFTDTPTGQQFQDIAPGSTYYTYIYRLVSRGVMSGYACGHTPAGPCIPPANLPYFVPNANATRGQTSKIVGNTFFPDCSFARAAKP